jgi:hypothetical protein
MLAPVLLPVFVIKPAAHEAQDASVETADHVPAVHAVHLMAPASLPALTNEPAKQTLQ